MINRDNENNFMLGELEVSPSHNQLAAQGKTLTLQPKVMAVLYYLARHQERVVSSEELMAQLWKGRIVTQGSVQKSINALRKALAEFLGEEEVIAYYSKRGYQLTLAPTFLEPGFLEPGLLTSQAQEVTPGRLNRVMLAALLLLACIGTVFLVFFNQPAKTPLPLSKDHKVQFASVSEYTSDAGHERDAKPHPDNRHLAYIRERLIARDRWEIDSQLMIRNDRGEDWQIASSQGSWTSPVWSPSGQYLVAVEVWRPEGLPPTPNFFEQANYLYTFHIFSLDLEQNRLREKHLLSQWQGRISSVTWWDETTLEFIASQGPGTNQARYRYDIFDQQLSLVDFPISPASPLMSAVMNARTALVSAHKHQLKIELVDEHQSSRASWVLDYSWVDISWIPDGSGILVFAEEQQKLLALYWDGTRQDIPLHTRLDRQISKPRYRPDGQTIYYTEERLRSNIEWLMPGHDKQRLTAQSFVNDVATFSPTGDRIVYTSVRDNELHLWLQENGSERQLTREPLTQKVSRIIWSVDGAQIVYKTGKRIVFHDVASGAESSLRLESNNMEPLAFDAEKQLLFVLKSLGESSNVWTISPNNLQQKQLTFGAVGSALEYAGKIYFQYRSKPGLWVLRTDDITPELVANKLIENSQLLAVDAAGVYFITGGKCRESDVYHLNFKQGSQATFLARDKNIVSTHSFHPQAGLLQSDCVLAESNILMLE